MKDFLNIMIVVNPFRITQAFIQIFIIKNERKIGLLLFNFNKVIFLVIVIRIKIISKIYIVFFTYILLQAQFFMRLLCQVSGGRNDKISRRCTLHWEI